jgi:N-acetylmuramoyl-L-alanine amidase
MSCNYKNLAKLFLLAIILSFANAASLAAEKIKINHMRVSVSESQYRFVFDLSDTTPYKYFILDKPDRVVLDIINAKLATELINNALHNTPVKLIRSNESKEKLRLVFDLKSKVGVNAFLLKPSGPYGERLVLDLETKEKQSTKSPTATVPLPEVRVPKKTMELRDVVIVIDPGHGGKDPGASGKQGTNEKHVVLAIAKNLQKQLNNTSGYKAVLTRGQDNYIPLRGRLRLAREGKADMFISIHADAFINNKAHGASVFALSERGASSEAARWLAEKENYSELGGVDLDNKSDVLRSVLLDLSQTATVAASLRLGDNVLRQLGTVTALHNKKVEQAGFVVLKSPDIPSILIETGFISHSNEEKLLSNKAYQEKLARAIANGIRQYFKQYAPQGTLQAADKQEKSYRVVAGDTLSSIAHKFHVSVAALQAANKLSGQTIRKGQVLKIPNS